MKYLSFSTGWCAAGLLSCWCASTHPVLMGVCLAICLAGDVFDWARASK